MNYPATFFIPLIVSLGLQGLLWGSDLFFIPWMDRTATLWMGLGSAAAALIFLLIYRVFATGMKSWHPAIVLCSLLQFASLADGLYFAWRAIFNA